MKVLSLIIFMVLASLACPPSPGPVQVFYYCGGNPIQVNGSDLDTAAVERIIVELFVGTTDMLRLHVDQERIDALKQTDTLLEITWQRETTMRSREFGEFKIRRMVIPLSGEFAGSITDPVVTLFVADGGFDSGPLRNPDGFPALQRLRSIVKKASEK